MRGRLPGAVGRTARARGWAILAGAVLLASVDAAGWSAQWASGTPPTFAPDTSPQAVSVTRAGFNSTGGAVTYAETRTPTRRVRQAFPNQATDTAFTVALDDYLYATDSIAGVTNNSTEVSPAPGAAWVMPGRSLVGNTLDWELIAFHRDGRLGRMAACAQVQATDGTTTTAWQTVSATSVSTLAEDACPVEVYKGTLDISALATGFVTLRGRVIPWIGGAASILDSANSTATREFSPRYFWKDAARLAAPPQAYVASTGSDSTGVWSTNAATAAASPFLTVGGAETAMDNATRGTPATGGYLDGCIINIVDTVSLGTTATSRAQKCAALIVRRAPGTARASATTTLTSAFRPRLGVGTLQGGLTEGAIRFYDVTVSRTVNTTFSGEVANQLNVQFHNMTIANAGTLGTWLSNAHDWFFGVQLTGFNGNLGQTTLQHRIMRGLTVDFANGGAPECWVTVGCSFANVKGCSSADPTKGAIWFANKYLSPDSTTAPIQLSAVNSGDTMSNIFVVQNLIEVTHANAATPAIRIATDTPAHGNTYHAIIAYNTVTGYGSAGRDNDLYDNNGGAEVRTHRLMRVVGNIFVQLNNKGDVFVGTSGGNPTDAPNHIGHFAFHHGVGCQGNFTMFAVASSTPFSELQAYPGLKSNIGASSTVRNDPLFANYQGTGGSAGTPATGAGGGTYTLQSGSPAKGIVLRAMLAFTLDGVARAIANDNAGALSAAA